MYYIEHGVYIVVKSENPVMEGGGAVVGIKAYTKLLLVTVQA